MSNLSTALAGTIAYSSETSSAQAWFAGGERAGYDPKARAIVPAQGAPLNVFLRGEGDLTRAVTFLPGFPDGSFGWAKVRPYLPSAARMPKLFFDYVGMGDSDKPKEYTYSTAERADLVESI
jgi:pimeloyl-ACP methyl ester carboxylesterase